MSKSKPPKPDRADAHVLEAERCLARGNPAGAEMAATLALAMKPRHSRALLALARVDRTRAQLERAQQNLELALESSPEDREIRRELATVLAARGRRAEAIAMLSDPPPEDAEGWFALGCQHDADGDAERAMIAARKALALAPEHAGALLLAARCHSAVGDIDAAAAIYRQLTQRKDSAARAWFALLDLKTEVIGDEERLRLRRLHDDPKLGDDERSFAAFALGHAWEQARNPAEAYGAFESANRSQWNRLRWDADAFSAQVSRIQQVFAEPAPHDSTVGEEVVFLVGMPRSGSTLAEQVLAAHEAVTGASELPDLPQVLAAESKRRGRRFPEWADAATAHDWRRLGDDYLARTQRFQSTRRYTDKYPENWLHIGAIARMLPGARILVCERDPIETLWSCYKQLFAPGHFAWSYDFDALARYAIDCRRLTRYFVGLEPDRCRLLSHESLVRDLETQLRAMLDFIGLEFDARCLDFFSHRRQTRTASAAQVRQPLRQVTPRGVLYGALLDPLRDALERAESAAGSG